nr:hypothetical protein [bacterium]
VLFGGLGNDWLTGGTNRDHLYGGLGDDLLDADDDGATRVTDERKDDFYADTAFGGGGRDVLIANTGADRLLDWVGEFNSFIVPFSPFGGFTITRSPSPNIEEFLYDLAESDGADQTRVSTGSKAADRHGEPFGELGLVKQSDDIWQEQTGGPADPQAGNNPGEKKDKK